MDSVVLDRPSHEEPLPPGFHVVRWLVPPYDDITRITYEQPPGVKRQTEVPMAEGSDAIDRDFRKHVTFTDEASDTVGSHGAVPVAHYSGKVQHLAGYVAAGAPSGYPVYIQLSDEPITRQDDNVASESLPSPTVRVLPPAPRARETLNQGLEHGVVAEEPPMWELAEEIAASVPDAEWDNVPSDLARNLDHYLYGAPKETE